MQQNKLMKRTALYCVMFAAAAMTAMLYFSANKIIVVADVAQDEIAANEPEKTAQTEQTEQTESIEDKNLIKIDRDSHNTNYFCIPLPDGVKAEEVMVENHYMDRELWVSIPSDGTDGREAFYETASASGNCENVVYGHLETAEERIRLQFMLTDVYEYKSIFENNALYVEFVPPKEVYEKIVVIDAAYGDNDMGVRNGDACGKDVTLNVARALKAKLDSTDIKVYYTRMDDSNPENAKRINLANATKADMLIRIEVGESENTKDFGTEAIYNSRFFIPGFGSVELADLLEREVVTATSGKANGLVEASEEDEVIVNSTVPAAGIKVGYLTNGQEAILLQRNDYAERIAEGIYNAILKAYEEQP